MNLTIKRRARERGITRLCHFTQSRNLPHILEEGRILSIRDLRELGLPINTNDALRLDGHDGLISCSVEYPNSWFLSVAKTREVLFKDWVILELDPLFLWAEDTLFCPVNAATGRGRWIRSGEQAFDAIFDVFPPASNQSREMHQLKSCPTDDQAEVLVGTPIATTHIIGIITASLEQARVEKERLGLLNIETPGVEWKASAELFDARRLSGRIRSGERPVETVIDSSQT